MRDVFHGKKEGTATMATKTKPCVIDAIAAEFGVTGSALRIWLRNGKVPGARKTPAGWVLDRKAQAHLRRLLRLRAELAGRSGRRRRRA
jgi:hypothetical protein